MTYRMDSDIVHPYGWFEPINLSIISIHPGPEEYRKWTNNNKDNNSGNITLKAKRNSSSFPLLSVNGNRIEKNS